MLNVVLDTNVLVSGLLSAKGHPAQIVNAFKANQFNFFYSAEIMLEYRDVLSRSRFGFEAKDVDDLLDTIATIGFPVIPEISKIQLPDEDDRVFYDVAKSSGSYLITGNIKHYPSEPLVVTPAQFVALIASEN